MVNVSKIRDLCSERGIKLVFLIEKLGLKSRTYFQDIEKSGRDISLDRLEIIADTLGTTVEYLTDQTDDPSKEKKPSFISDETWTKIKNDPSALKLLEMILKMSPEQRDKFEKILEEM